MRLLRSLPKWVKSSLRTIAYSFNYPRDLLFCLYYFGHWNASWRFYKLPVILNRSKNITIGTKFTACSSAYHNSIGVFQRVTIKTLTKHAKIEIGDRVGISGATISSASQITIGSGTLVGSGALIMDHDAHGIHPSTRNNPLFIRNKPIIVGENVFIGARSIILKGVNIGQGAVVAAGSVVTGSVEPMTIVAGNPAKVMGSVLQEKHLISNLDLQV